MTSDSLFIDPKTQYLTSLIRHIDKIAFLLSVNPKQYAESALELGILLDRIHIPQSRQDLTKLQKEFDEENYIHLSKNEIRQCFRVICNYLNNTYFKGYDAAIGNKDFVDLEHEDESEG